MNDPLRLGGRATIIGGDSITWSVAEGVRGRRWREAVERDGVLLRSLMLEVTAAGRPTRLEVTTTHGLLTLHPEPDERMLHGNVVTPSGIRHLRFDWSPEHDLLVLGSPACAAVGLGRLAGSLGVGDATAMTLLRIDDTLEPRLVTWTATRTGQRDWSLLSPSGDEERRLTLDETGLVALPDASTWPLELD